MAHLRANRACSIMSRPTVSLVLIDTNAYALSAVALNQCLSRFAFDDVLLFSDNDQVWGGQTVHRVARFRSIADYNDVLLNRLPEYLRTDFFLVIQYDGFILDEAQFSPHFFHYDYIGAPWGNYPHFNVGNGGFSWRSRKLAEAAARLNYGKDEHELAEDLFLCRQHRVWLETKENCNFAPEAIASHFSIETGTRRFPTFGFHGVFHLPEVYRNMPEFLVQNVTERILRSDIQFSLLANAMRRVSEPCFNELLRRRKSLDEASQAARLVPLESGVA